MKKNPSTNKFRPWREDFIAAYFFFAVAAFALWRIFVLQSISTTVMGLAFAGGFAYAGVWAWKNGMRRWYGKSLEGWAIERLSALLYAKRIPYRTNEMVAGVGDVDFIAHTKKGLVVVEIKAFEKWSQNPFVGKANAPREQQAFAQTAQQVERLGAVAGFIWMPRGRPTLLQRLVTPRCDGVKVIMGSEGVMAKHIAKINGTYSSRLLAPLFFLTRH